jgi:hypothetical protein
MKKVKDWFTRARTANLLMASFIIMTTTGAFLFNPALGFAVAGLTCGALGLLLGMD